MGRSRSLSGAGLCASFVCWACSSQPPAGSDPIQGFPPAQQVTITRAAVEKDWPLTVGKGTLGCQAGAVVFRANGVSYAVNDAAGAQGFASIEPPSPAPSNPLGRLKPEERMRIFAESAACEDPNRPEPTTCIAGLRSRHRLSESDLDQIAAEGKERSWPPLRREKADLQAFEQRGLKLCRP